MKYVKSTTDSTIKFAGNKITGLLNLMEKFHELIYNLHKKYYKNCPFSTFIFKSENSLKNYSPYTIMLFTIFSIFLISLIKKIKKRLRLGKTIFSDISGILINIIGKLPSIKGQIEKEKKGLFNETKTMFKKEKYKPIEFRDNKQEYTKILAKLEAYLKQDSNELECGKLTGSVYCQDHTIKYIGGEACKMYCYCNLLHPDLYTSSRFLESQLLKIVIELFHGNRDACGVTTSGGTFSLLAAVYAYNKRARENGITEPELIFAESGHAAMDKACEMFNIIPIKIPLDKKTYQMDLRKVKKAISKNTIAIVGSFPNFPHTIYDDIEGLSKIAVSYNIPLHVDCCLGGFLVAFYEKANIQIPLFDFRLPGVTSISVDLHKYGLAPKGISILLFSKHEYRKYCYFFYPKWMGGLYFSTGFDGSRTSGIIAAAYAVLTSNGQLFYTEIAKKIHDAVLKLKDFIKKELPLLHIIGDPEINGVAFTCEKIEYIYDALSKKGYHLNYLTNPPAVGFIFTQANVDNIDQFIIDLKETYQKVEKNEVKVLGKITKIYGMAFNYPETLTKDILYAFGDEVLD